MKKSTISPSREHSAGVNHGVSHAAPRKSIKLSHAERKEDNMKIIRLTVAAILIVVSAFMLNSAHAHAEPVVETVTVDADRPIPNLPGKRMVSLIVDYPPGARSPAHHHARTAFIYAYVLTGDIRSQVDDEPPQVYGPGESWFESPGAHHRVSANESDTAPARLLAIFIVDSADVQLTTQDPQ